MTEIVLDLELAEKLAADFTAEVSDCVETNRHVLINRKQVGEVFAVAMDPQQFLAWCWQHRRAFMSDMIRRRIESAANSDLKAFESGTSTATQEWSAKRGIRHTVERQYEHREKRIATAARRFNGQMSEHFAIPDTHDSMPVGLMTSKHLNLVAAALRKQAHQTMRKARFLRRLAAGLPDGVTVGDHYTEDQVDSMWATMQALAS